MWCLRGSVAGWCGVMPGRREVVVSRSLSARVCLAPWEASYGTVIGDRDLAGASAVEG